MATTAKEIRAAKGLRAGRPREYLMRGPGYELSEFIDKKLLGVTNLTCARALGIQSENVVSMWRQGRSKVPLERLAELTKLMGADLATTLPMWLKQSFAKDPNDEVIKARLNPILETLERTATKNEEELLSALRQHLKGRDVKYAPEVIEAMIAAMPDELTK